MYQNNKKSKIIQGSPWSSNRDKAVLREPPNMSYFQVPQGTFQRPYVFKVISRFSRFSRNSGHPVDFKMS